MKFFAVRDVAAPCACLRTNNRGTFNEVIASVRALQRGASMGRHTMHEALLLRRDRHRKRACVFIVENECATRREGHRTDNLTHPSIYAGLEWKHHVRNSSWMSASCTRPPRQQKRPLAPCFVWKMGSEHDITARRMRTIDFSKHQVLAVGDLSFGICKYRECVWQSD